MTSIANAAEEFAVGLEKAEADLRAIAHRLEQEEFEQHGRQQVNYTRGSCLIKCSHNKLRQSCRSTYTASFSGCAD